MYSKTNYYFLENLFFSFCSLIDTHAVKIMKREMQFPLSIKAMWQWNIFFNFKSFISTFTV